MIARENAYHAERKKLAQIVRNLRNIPSKHDLFRAGYWANHLLKTYHPETMSDTDLTNMIEWIKGINAVLLNPLDDIALSIHINNTNLAKTYGNDDKWLNVFAGAMATIAGIALTAFCLTMIGLIISGTLPATGTLAAISSGIGAIVQMIAMIGSAFKTGYTPAYVDYGANSPFSIMTFATGAVVGSITAVVGTMFTVDSYKGPVRVRGEWIEDAVHSFKTR
jgi:hypothetical protein